MGRNDIRLRRQGISAGRIARHRNYGELMARHEREQKLKRIVRMFVYFLVIAFLLILFVIITRWEKKAEDQQFNTTPSEQAHATSVETEKETLLVVGHLHAKPGIDGSETVIR